MAEQDRFEVILGAALERYADEMPERRDLDALAESISARPRRRGLMDRLASSGSVPTGFDSPRPAFRVAWMGVAWVVVLALLLVAIVASAALVGGWLRPSELSVKPPATPPPLAASPVTLSPTALADRLVAAWNAGDGQRAAALYHVDPYPTSPVAQFRIDSADATDVYVTAASLADGVAAWHAKGFKLSRTGEVLTQGAYAAFPVTWDTTDGSFAGVDVLRLSANDLVVEQELIGARASGQTSDLTAADSTRIADDERIAANAAKSAAASAGPDGSQGLSPGNGAVDSALSRFFDPSAQLKVMQDGFQRGDRNGRQFVVAAIIACPCTTDRTGDVVTQGPFVVYPAFDTKPSGLNTGPSDETLDGFTVLELSGDGLITSEWDVRRHIVSPSANGAPSSPAPTPSGG